MALGAEFLPGWRGVAKPDPDEQDGQASTPSRDAESRPDSADSEQAERAAPEAAPTSVPASTTTGGGSSQEPVVVWQANNRLEAQIVKGRLESEGVPAFLSGEALGTIYGFTTGQLAVTSVLVPGPLAEKAVEILNAEVDWGDWNWEDEHEDSDASDSPD